MPEGSARHFQTRGRTYVLSDQGVIAFDEQVSMTATRAAGLPMPCLGTSTSTPTGAVSFATAKRRRYRGVIARTMSDGYVLRSAVSMPLEVSNTCGSTVDLAIGFNWTTQHGVVAGDVLELYRTKDTATAVDPGDRYFLAATVIATSAHVAGLGAGMRDSSLDTNLGAELYTNPGQEGLGQTNLPPPCAIDAVMYKGHAFYVSRRLPAQYTVSARGNVGSPLSSAADRQNGIGVRALTGDTTLGLPTILNGSSMVGIEIGQIVVCANFANGTRITNVSGTTITCSTNSTATTVGVSLTTRDVIEWGAGASDYTNIVYPSAFEEWLDTSLDFEIYSDKPETDAITVSTVVDHTSLGAGGTYIFRAKRYCDGTFTLRATNGNNYTPALPSTSSTAVSASYDERKNRIHFSKLDQPEAVPSGNYFYVGAGEIYRVIAMRDALLAFCSDGLYRISGDAGEWRVDPIDKTLVLGDRRAVDIMNDVVFAFTNRGLVSVDASGTVTELTTDKLGGYDGIVGQTLDDPGIAVFGRTKWLLACDPFHDEVMLYYYLTAAVVGYFIYNRRTDAFTTMSIPHTVISLAYSRGRKSIVFADTDATPDLLYFYGDDSTTRMSDTVVTFQPITPDANPFTQKNFLSCDWLFQGFASAATLVPAFSGTNYTSRAIATSTYEQRARVSVPRNAPALASTLRPGFTLSGGASSQIWSMRGLDVRWVPASEDSLR
jgi:hypothetical protein